QPGQPWQGSHHLGLVASLDASLGTSLEVNLAASQDGSVMDGLSSGATFPTGAPSAEKNTSSDNEQLGALLDTLDASPGEMLAEALAESRGGDYPLLPSMRTLLALCARYMPIVGLELIYDAYQVAAKAHDGVYRKTGEPYIEHPIAVATLLAELALDAEGIAAALLHDTVEDTDLSVDTVRDHFGDTIALIVDGVTKFNVVEAPTPHPLSQLPPHSDVILPARAIQPPQSDSSTPTDAQARRENKARQQIETFNKLFVAMLDDPRVVLLKLADRLHNLRTMAAMSPAQREVKSHETLDIFAPLAGRIGLYLYKIELEDLAFSYIQPDDYIRISALLREEERRRAGWAHRLCLRMQRELAARGLIAAVNWRMKSPYSAYRDIRQSGLDVSQLDDVIAFRVIVSNVPQCYQSLGVIHHIWPPYPDAFHDYIAAPKVNGYQSLHTAVFALDGRLAQLHIRTHEMHRATQHGVALRWLEVAATGDAATGATALAVKRANLWVRQIEAWRNEMKLSAKEFVDTIKGEIFEDQVFVSTPKGDVFELPAGSTVLDMAYRIHTRLGDTTVGARVYSNSESGALVAHVESPAYTLRTGDVVRVLTDPNARPQQAWLSIVRTRYATEKISRSLRLLARANEQGRTPHQSDPQSTQSTQSATGNPA
ncbi:MAG TPA: HD domain-containing protein, partial [Ktedonobacterales bacterium]|nr:HD domain-containing protein [Ktedonobacterales bacterium]